MPRADSLALPGAHWGAGYLEDVSHRRLVLEHYDQERAALLRYLSCLGLSVDIAEEILQETFLKLHQHVIAGGDRGNLRAWLYRVAHNLARNFQTSAYARKADKLPADSEKHALAWSGASAEEDLLARERLERLRRAISELGEAQRECLLLRAQGLKYREIAEVMSLSISTVGEHIQRGLEHLKEQL
jgi:RNA polymerase sigma-70 factor (ECF subfamily)